MKPTYHFGSLTEAQQEEGVDCTDSYTFFKEEPNDGTFHIEDADKIVACRFCGGKEFNVAGSAYFTAIRCTACHWEQCIHEG